MESLSGVVNSITGDKSKCVDKRRGGHGHRGGSSPILHQAVTWSLTSTLYNHPFNLTGVYIFPDEDQLQEFLDTLTTNSDHLMNHISAPETLMRTLPKNWKLQKQHHTQPLNMHSPSPLGKC